MVNVRDRPLRLTPTVHDSLYFLGQLPPVSCLLLFLYRQLILAYYGYIAHRRHTVIYSI